MSTLKMFRSILLITCLLSFHEALYSQTQEKQNPVIFLEETLGGTFGDAGGIAVGIGLNYQVKRNLFTVRYTGTAKFNIDIISPLVPLPYPSLNSSLDEVGLLYGQRFINNGHAYSISLGVSYNHFRIYDKSTSARYDVNSEYIGLPFEANIK
jgi:hypothetical protein